MLKMAVFSGFGTGLLSVLTQTGQTTELSLLAVLSTLIYGLVGLLLYALGYFIFDRVLRLDLRRELLEDQNQALGIMLGGVFIGIAIIIAAAII